MRTRYLLPCLRFVVIIGTVGTNVLVAHAAPVVWYGVMLSFLCPPLDPSSPPLDSQSPYQLTLGLGSEPVWIGSGVSIPTPGLYDLSSDPNAASFLDKLFNDTPDPLQIKITYAQGALSWAWPSGYEDFWFNNLQEGGIPRTDVSGIQLEVLSFYDSGDGITARWNLTDVPEPSTIVALLMGATLICVRRRSRHLPQGQRGKNRPRGH